MGKILVIDDEDQIRAMLRQTLEASGHEVLEASSGNEGVRIYQSHPVDLVVTDILMPDKEGLECILELRRINPEVTVIAISGGLRSNTLDVLDLARRFGARRAFWKPFDLTEVLAAVREALEDHRAA